MGAVFSHATEDEQVLMQAARIRRAAHCHSLDCRDPLLACMALVACVEQAHVGGCRTPPLTPMMMHFLNIAASEEQLGSSTPRTLTEKAPLACPNWCRNVTRSVSDGSVLARANEGSLCWRHVRFYGPRWDPDAGVALANAAPKITALSFYRLTATIEWLPSFQRLTALSVVTDGCNTGVCLDALFRSVPSLTSLECDGHDASELSALALLPFLRRVRLRNFRNLTNEGLATLQRCAGLQEVSTCACPQLTNVRRLTACRHLRQLHVLDGPASVTSSAVAVFCAVPSCETLTLSTPSSDDLGHLEHLDRALDVSVATAESPLTPLHDQFEAVVCRLARLRLGLRVTTFTLQGFRHNKPFDVTPLTALPALTSIRLLSRRNSVVGSLAGSKALTSLDLSGASKSAFRDGLRRADSDIAKRHQ